jgi:hypothetical protein
MSVQSCHVVYDEKSKKIRIGVGGGWQSLFPSVCRGTAAECLLAMNLFFTILVFSISTSYARSPEEIRAAIESQSSQRHPNPPVDFWKGLGPEALPVLKKMIEEEISNVERTWLIDGLGHFSDPEVGQLLQSKIKASSNDVFTKKLLSSLIQSQGDQALDFVEPYLSNSDPHIRIAVAQGIRLHMSSGRAKERLNQYLAGEKETWIQTRIASVDSGSKMERGGRVVQVPASAATTTAPTEEKPISALPERDWGGEWKGVYLSPEGSGAAKGFLKKEKEGWKLDLSLPKKKRIELKASEVEVQYFQTDHFHWIRVRGKKTDTVFTGNRKAN